MFCFLDPQVAKTLLTLLFVLTPPTYQVPLWSVHFFSESTPAPLTMVQTHLTPTLSTGTLPPPRVDRPPLHSRESSERTSPTTTLCLQRAALSVWGCRGGFEKVSKLFIYFQRLRAVVVSCCFFQSALSSFNGHTALTQLCRFTQPRGYSLV